MSSLVIGGIYKHKSGLLVKVLGQAQHSEDLKKYVYYVELKDGTTWIREKSMFLQEVEPGVQRFKLVDADPTAKPK
jgi:hypothetical protein